MTAHAIDRARERFGVELCLAEVRWLGRKIMRGESLLLHRQTRHGVVKELHIVRHGEIELPAVWCPETRAVVTFLPSDSTELRRWPRETWGPRNDVMRACVIESAEIVR